MWTDFRMRRPADVVGQGMRWVMFAMMLGVGCRGDAQKCEQAVRNYATLVYWQQADKAIAAAPPDQRTQLRVAKSAEFHSQLERGVQTLVTQCTSANNKDQINCMIDAKTAAQAKQCSGH